MAANESSRPSLAGRALLIVAAAACAAVVFVPPAQAAESRVASYSYERVWPASIRYLRIDCGYKIIEKDVEAGYILFEAKEDSGRTVRGSVELIRTKDYADRDAVKLVARIPDKPSYEEGAVLDQLLIKLRQDLGEPVDPPAEKPKPDETPDKKPDDADKTKPPGNTDNDEQGPPPRT